MLRELSEMSAGLSRQIPELAKECKMAAGMVSLIKWQKAKHASLFNM